MTCTSPEESSAQIPIPFADPPSRRGYNFGNGESFGIWSCRFSADGNEVVAGGSGKIFGNKSYSLAVTIVLTSAQYMIC